LLTGFVTLLVVKVRQQKFL